MSFAPDSTTTPDPSNLPILPETSQNVTKDHRCADFPPPAPTPVEVQRTQPPAPATFPLLSARQLSAIPLILLGQSDSQVANSVGVTRESVCRWRNSHPRFIAELHRQRSLRHAALADRYNNLLDSALSILEEFNDSEEVSLEDVAKMASSLVRSASRRTFAPLPAATPLLTPDEILSQLLSLGIPPSPDDSPADDAPPPPPPEPKRRR